MLGTGACVCRSPATPRASEFGTPKTGILRKPNTPLKTPDRHVQICLENNQVWKLLRSMYNLSAFVDCVSLQVKAIPSRFAAVH